MAFQIAGRDYFATQKHTVHGPVLAGLLAVGYQIFSAYLPTVLTVPALHQGHFAIGFVLQQLRTPKGKFAEGMSALNDHFLHDSPHWYIGCPHSTGATPGAFIGTYYALLAE